MLRVLKASLRRVVPTEEIQLRCTLNRASQYTLFVAVGYGTSTGV